MNVPENLTEEQRQKLYEVGKEVVRAYLDEQEVRSVIEPLLDEDTCAIRRDLISELAGLFFYCCDVECGNTNIIRVTFLKKENNRHKLTEYMLKIGRTKSFYLIHKEISSEKAKKLVHKHTTYMLLEAEYLVEIKREEVFSKLY